MKDRPIQMTGSCGCGQAKFSMVGRPLLRAYCHCRICQAFNQSAYADIAVFYAKDILLKNEDNIAFRVHQQPPLLKRGTCKSCGKPAIERLNIPLMPGMVIIPSSNIHDPAFLPEPALHIFYHRRTADMTDVLPKHNGFLNSQARFSLALVMAMLRGGARAA